MGGLVSCNQEFYCKWKFHKLLDSILDDDKMNEMFFLDFYSLSSLLLSRILNKALRSFSK